MLYVLTLWGIWNASHVVRRKCWWLSDFVNLPIHGSYIESNGSSWRRNLSWYSIHFGTSETYEAFLIYLTLWGGNVYDFLGLCISQFSMLTLRGIAVLDLGMNISQRSNHSFTSEHYEEFMMHLTLWGGKVFSLYCEMSHNVGFIILLLTLWDVS